MHIQVGSLLGVLDRRDKDAITLLFAAIPNKQPSKAKQRQKELGRLPSKLLCRIKHRDPLSISGPRVEGSSRDGRKSAL